MRSKIPLPKAYLLLNHGPTTLVTTAFQSKRNIMAAAWAMAIDFDPPKIAIVIAADTYTRKLLEESGEFGLSLPTQAQADLTYTVGRCSGEERDKFGDFGIKTFPSEKIEAPLIEGCIGWLECKRIPEPEMERKYDLFIGEAVNAWVEDSLFGEYGWTFGVGTPATLHHISGGTFAAPLNLPRSKKLFDQK